MVKCPYCQRPAMGLARKSSLGPGRAVKCESCGKLVATHWLAIFAAFPAFLGGLAMMRSDSLSLGIAAVASGVIAMALIHTFAIPLIKVEAG